MNEVETRGVSIPIAVIVPLIATILSGCFIGDPDISGLDVHNDTDHTIWVDEFPQTEENARFKVAVGDQTIVLTRECAQRRIEAQTRSGRVIAVLDEEWCPGQNWNIRGQDEWSLEDPS